MSSREPERDKLFDHDYDGIREYDNPLPRWWVFIFVGTILFCFPYVVYYHFTPGRTIYDALDREVAAYADKLLATYGELTPDEDTILRFMDDDVAMTGMASLFKGRCAQCHLADGSGNVGPNLTDDSWIHVKTLTDIPRVIKNGVPLKGMPAWGERLTDTQIVLLSAYVARLRRNPVPGKAPQGEVIPPWPTRTADTSPPAGSR
ncbi:MAG: cytochrome C oxidase Cbb3 [Acidobacteria bacterium]|nr:MAG: cytochrome C oxidase Cbb3 [Acidobacteriota bacterium]